MPKLKFLRRTKTRFSKSFDHQLKTKPPKPLAEKEKSEKIACFWNADQSGCAWWRMEMPRLALHFNKRAAIQSLNSTTVDTEDFLPKNDAFKVQRQLTNFQLDWVEFLAKIRKKTGANLIFDIDDICIGKDIPQYNAMRDGFQSEQVIRNFKEVVGMCDEMHVPSQYMADYYKSELNCNNITVIPNMPLKMWYWDLYDQTAIERNYNLNRKRPKILWAGSGTHADVKNKTNQKDDFHHMLQAVIKTRKQYEWIFFGVLPKLLEPYHRIGEITYIPWVSLHDYPRVFQQTGAQMVVAPLVDNHFNRAKSDIKWREAACLGLNGVFQDLDTYKDAHYKFKTGDELLDQVSTVLGDPNRYISESINIRKRAEQEFFVDTKDNLDMVWASLFTKFKSEERKLASPKLFDLNQ